MPRITVVGAGVSGLTSALLLSKNPSYKIKVIAKHMPGDYDIEYTSPWAGANYLPVSSTEGSRYEKATWPELERLAREVPKAGIHFQDAVIYGRKKDADTNVGKWFADLVLEKPWYSDVVPNFRLLDKAELPEGVDSGNTFGSVCINTALYLPWLVSECLAAGVVFERAVLKHISEATAEADLVVNCTGLMASKLGGVMDETVIPASGQIVVVRNSAGGSMYTISGVDDDSVDEVSYLMERAAGGGTVLGGTYQKGKWESQPDPNVAIRIMKRAIQLCPALVKPGQGIEGLSVIRHWVGLRPLREGGVRIEKEETPDGKWIVHNYGHGGWGYQASYGCSEHVVELVDEALGEQAKA